jgi:hypothetical protein
MGTKIVFYCDVCGKEVPPRNSVLNGQQSMKITAKDGLLNMDTREYVGDTKNLEYELCMVCYAHIRRYITQAVADIKFHSNKDKS